MCRHVRDATFSEVGANPPPATSGDGASQSTSAMSAASTKPPASNVDLDGFDVSDAVTKGKSV
jgi:hypothetical protein